MSRLPKAEWDELDRLLGKHGFAGYYDLVECLKQVAGDLGISLTGIDLYPEVDGGKSISLPQMVQYLQDWARILENTDGFQELAEKASQNTDVKKGGDSPC